MSKITIDQALIDQALEVLTDNRDDVKRCESDAYMTQYYDKAISDLREALAQSTSGDYARGYAEGFNDACKPAQPQQKPLTDWVNVDERLPEKGGYYIVTVDTDDGPHVDVLLFNDRRKYWEHEGEPTYGHGYLFSPTHWANRPEAAHGIKDTP